MCENKNCIFFLQSYGKTSFHGGSGEKTEWNCTVAGRKVRYNIVDTSGGRTYSLFVVFELFGIPRIWMGTLVRGTKLHLSTLSYVVLCIIIFHCIDLKRTCSLRQLNSHCLNVSKIQIFLIHIVGVLIFVKKTGIGAIKKN